MHPDPFVLRKGFTACGGGVQVFNPSIREAKAGGSLSSGPALSTVQVPGQPGLLHKEILIVSIRMPDDIPQEDFPSGTRDIL